MSEYATQVTIYSDRDALVAALAKRYAEVEVHEDGAQMLNYYGRESGLAQVIVRKAHLKQWGTNDLGFTLDPLTGTYSATYDDMYHSAEWFDALNVDYQIAHYSAVASQLGYAGVSATVTNGVTELEFMMA